MSRKIIILVFLFGIAGLQLLAQPAGRENFDAGWKFHLGDVSGAENPGFQDEHWRVLDLPHD